MAARRSQEAATRKIPASNGKRGNNARASPEATPSELVNCKPANVPKRSTAVALVGPSAMKRDPAKSDPAIAATADPKIPYFIGIPATKA